jgi:small-conductance mechanosensitive channel
LQSLFAWAPPWVFSMLLMAIALVVALVAHAALVRLIRRSLHAGRRPKKGGDFWAPLLVKTRAPSRLALVIIAVSAALSAAPLTGRGVVFAQHVLAIAFVVLLGWVALVAVDVGAALFLRKNRIDVADNLTARKHLTQIRILQRAVSVLVIVLTVGFALMTIDQVRQWGVSLLAAGGAAGILVGLALQPLLSNLMAGIQIAATQPIRLEDEVKVENEVGTVEEITATYVVVRLWDERRMVLPLTYFLQKPFQNWTREQSCQTGAVVLLVDFATPVESLRAKLKELLEASPLWDRRVATTQVTDSKDTKMEVRFLMSAADPGRLFELRCHVREAMIRYLREELPYALPTAKPQAEDDDALAGGERRAPEPAARPQ